MISLREHEQVELVVKMSLKLNSPSSNSLVTMAHYMLEVHFNAEKFPIKGMTGKINSNLRLPGADLG